MASTKTVTVLNVYKFNHIARICFVVESSSGDKTYNTCFNHDAEHGACDCDGFAKYHRCCYHLKQLKERAQAYFDGRKPAVAPVQRVQREDWKESSQFGSQVHKMEVAPSGRLVPMR